MINKVWLFMLSAAFFISAVNGRMAELSNALLTGTQEAVTLSFSLLGTMCLWSGLAKIAERSGLSEIIAKLLRPAIKLLFPKLDSNSPAAKAIVMNISANLLGMGNAATPLGIKAMKELKKISSEGGSASDEMCMFAVVNTASLQILPSTLIALRSTYHSQNPGEIIIPIWLTGMAVIFTAVTLTKIFSFKNKKVKK